MIFVIASDKASMKLLSIIVLLAISCGREPKGTTAKSRHAEPVPTELLNSPYICKDSIECADLCETNKSSCYGSCIGDELEIRNCKVFKCDGNFNTCMNQVYSR